MAYERVGPEGEAALTEDLRGFLAEANTAGERAMVLEAEYLEVDRDAGGLAARTWARRHGSCRRSGAP